MSRFAVVSVQQAAPILLQSYLSEFLEMRVTLTALAALVAASSVSAYTIKEIASPYASFKNKYGAAGLARRSAHHTKKRRIRTRSAIVERKTTNPIAVTQGAQWIPTT